MNGYKEIKKLIESTDDELPILIQEENMRYTIAESTTMLLDRFGEPQKVHYYIVHQTQLPTNLTKIIEYYENGMVGERWTDNKYNY